MGNYILSSANRFYVAPEAVYGQTAAAQSANRFQAIRMDVRQQVSQSHRRDKTGARTFQGTSPGARRNTTFQISSYLTPWNGDDEPGYGPLFRSALGAEAEMNGELRIQHANGSGIRTVAVHQLSLGSAVGFGNEIRFVSSVTDELSFNLNAPFSSMPPDEALMATTVTYRLASNLPSVTLYDYWDSTIATRVISGAVINDLQISLEGDYHALTFSGHASTVLAATNPNDVQGISSEPALSDSDTTVVPGHLGQVWLGSTANQFFTLSSAYVRLNNNIKVRNNDFGVSYTTGVAAGLRDVTVSFELFAQDDAQANALYAAAMERSSISAMLQLGNQQGRIMGIYIPAVIPEMPIYNDADNRLQWKFENTQGQGVANDEIFIAFS